MYRSKLNEKLQESLAAVLPILAIVLILSFTIAPLPTSVLMAFLFGAVLLVVGMMFFCQFLGMKKSILAGALTRSWPCRRWASAWARASPRRAGSASC